MAEQIIISAEFRETKGKGAARRMRARADKVPGVLYGGKLGPVSLAISYRELSKAMQEEAFFSQLLELTVGDKTQTCVLRDLQRHPATDKVQHVDFQRVQEDLPIHMHVPVHFLNEEHCVGVRQSGGRLAHNLVEVEVNCLPKHLPEFIEVDVRELDVGTSLHLSDLDLPEGVSVAALALGPDHDIPVVSVTTRRGGALGEEEEGGAAAQEDAGESAEDS